ncbi:alpha/beta hydrolase [Xanthobacter sp. DSM 24535]|uniref:alpha/beta fold hydrolase n=1 Tax=Roseixanthobacter psychrophilus TaxID=3119917 RepID=UPI00372C1066
MTPAPEYPTPESAVAGLPRFVHRYADVNGARLHYVIGGVGPKIVLLHGFPYTWMLWRELMPLLADAGFTVIAADLRGLGHSSKPEDGYDCLNVAEDIREIVRLSGGGPINLVGVDIGAMVAYAYASRHPQEIGALVFAESLIPGFGLEELMNPATGGYWHFGFHAQVDVASMLTEGKEAAYLLPWYGMMSAAPDASDRAKTMYLPHYAAPGGMRGGFKHYETLVADGKANRAAFAGKLPVPVLVLSGERGIPQAQTLGCVEQVATIIEADTVPQAAHTFASDNPDWVSKRLVRFFNQARRGVEACA